MEWLPTLTTYSQTETHKCIQLHTDTQTHGHITNACTCTRTQTWVRGRLAAAGLPRPDKVFCVSAPKAVNVRPVAEDIRSALGFRGDLWVVGAQNVGKSSLISALKRLGGTGGQRELIVGCVCVCHQQ